MSAVPLAAAGFALTLAALTLVGMFITYRQIHKPK